MSRDHILHKVRTALGRSAGQQPLQVLEARLRIPEVTLETRLSQFSAALQALGGKFYRAVSADDARGYVGALVAGLSAVASNSPYLEECGVTGLPGVRSGFLEEPELRALSAVADFGITSADYGLADTGSLVMLSSQAEARMISLLPPVHVAVFPKERMLTGLDELLTVMPLPAGATSSMVLITGPSRTADIEQILVRGVHGPGEIHVVVV